MVRNYCQITAQKQSIQKSIATSLNVDHLVQNLLKKIVPFKIAKRKKPYKLYGINLIGKSQNIYDTHLKL